MTSRLCLGVADEWRDGVITLLDASSPYRPWRLINGDPQPGDRAIMVLRTDPVSVVTQLAGIEQVTDITGASLSLSGHSADAAELTTVAEALGLSEDYVAWDLDTIDTERLSQLLQDISVSRVGKNTEGHCSLSAARILLDFNGYCAGCGDHIDLSDDDARARVHIHTVDHDRDDWSAVLCTGCRDRMRDGKIRSLADFKFAQHPECPQCGGRRSQVIQYGMPMGPSGWAPWVSMGGCCVGPERWHCQACGHRWQ